MYANELQPYNYKLPYVIEGVFMVGWIDSSHTYNSGKVDPTLLDKLWSMTRTRSSALDLHVNTVRGIHPCTLCSEDIHITDANGKPTFLGMSELWIPYRTSWYAAPTMIAHFIEQHEYSPPLDFLNAISEFDFNSHTISQDIYDKAVRMMAARGG